MSPVYYHVPRYCGIYYVPQVVVNTPPQPSWLPQVSLSTLSKIHDTASSTTLTQTFINPSTSSAIAKAKYNFPLYESCAVTSFCCYVGKRRIEGVVKEKEEAKAKYKEAVDRGETAGLLEQRTPDVFTTSLGNIPAGETVKVEIGYIMELKHDAEVDGLRFTIPTSIAPRYGDAPSGIGAFPEANKQDGMKISIQVTMPSNIRNVSSPSHPISMHLGGHSEDTADDAFNPKYALANLSQVSTELGKDFVLFVKCADLSSPRAILEVHPTIPDSKALMVTLVPKFNLPPGPKPEVVFVVDRSGSMGPRINALKSSLRAFLKSLPLGIRFNICSFGTNHSFLWNKSEPYSAESLEHAQRHVESMNADYGGTQILPPIESTIKRRYKDLPLEVMVLTDGEVWNSGDLFKYIEQATASGDVRLFSLGIGQDVSHALVEGMARVGRGFAQIVSDETGEMEGKVVRMLRGGLSVHIKDYRLEWEGKSVEQVVRKPSDSKSSPSKPPSTAKKISLFDMNVDSEPPISFSNLPEFAVPSVLQAPYNIPPLFPFSRTTAYAILAADVPPPQSVWLRGSTPSGDELELEIVVQTMQEKGTGIHQLGARKILQELEEGTGYIHSGKYGVDKELDAGNFEDWVQREGVRVGVKYGVASKWTSFLAVTRTPESPDKEEAPSMDIDSEADEDENEFEFISSSFIKMKSQTTGRPPGVQKGKFAGTFGSGSQLYPQAFQAVGGGGSLAKPIPMFAPPQPYFLPAPSRPPPPPLAPSMLQHNPAATVTGFSPSPAAAMGMGGMIMAQQQKYTPPKQLEMFSEKRPVRFPPLHCPRETYLCNNPNVANRSP